MWLVCGMWCVWLLCWCALVLGSARATALRYLAGCASCFLVSFFTVTTHCLLEADWRPDTPKSPTTPRYLQFAKHNNGHGDVSSVARLWLQAVPGNDICTYVRCAMHIAIHQPTRAIIALWLPDPLCKVEGATTYCMCSRSSRILVSDAQCHNHRVLTLGCFISKLRRLGHKLLLLFFASTDNTSTKL